MLESNSGRSPVSRRGRMLALFCIGWLTLSFASPTAVQDDTSELAITPAVECWKEKADACAQLGELGLAITAPENRSGDLSVVARGDRLVRTSSKRIPAARVVEEEKGPRLRSLSADRGATTRVTNEVLLASRLSSEPRVRSLLRGVVSASDFEMLAASSSLHSPEDDRLVGVPPVLADLVNNNDADVLATAYAPDDPFHMTAGPFDALLGGDATSGRFVPPIMEGDHAWMKNPLPAAAFSAPDQKCLATAIYFEARGEDPKGQAAVAQVILNRVRNPAYPDTICGVVYQNQDWFNKCQFSFACDGIPEIINNRRAFQLAEEVAMAVTGGKIFLPKVASSTHYFATYVSPEWARSMDRMTQIGSHIFYRTINGGWS